MSSPSKRPKPAIRSGTSSHHSNRHKRDERRVSFKSAYSSSRVPHLSLPSSNGSTTYHHSGEVYVEEITFDPLDAPDVVLGSTRRKNPSSTRHHPKFDSQSYQQCGTNHSANASAAEYTDYQTPRGYGESSNPSSASSSKYKGPSRLLSQSAREGITAKLQRGDVASSASSSSSSKYDYSQQQHYLASQSTTDIPQSSSNYGTAARTSVYQISQLERELYAPVEGAKHSSGSKARREVYRLDKHISSIIIPKFTPRELASTKTGAQILTEIAEMQKRERINQLMASQIASVKYARLMSSGYQSSLRSNTRGRTPEDRILPSYARHLHSRSGGKSRSLPSFVSSNGKEYTIRSSGSRQYAHHKHDR